MNILFLQSYPEWTPMTRVHAVLMEGLRSLGVTAHMACPPSSDPARPGTLERLRLRGFRTMELELLPSMHPETTGRSVALVRGTLAVPFRLARLVSYIRRNEIRVVHVPSHARDLMAGLVAARTSRIAMVAHLHTNFARWFSRSMRWGLEYADAVLCVSEFSANSARENGIASRKIHVVPNAIDLGSAHTLRDRDEVRRSLGIPPDAPVLGMVARIVPWKGQDRLIAAFAEVRREIPLARLLLIGGVQDTHPDSHAYEAALRREVQRLELQDAVQFLGVRNDVPDLLGALDVFAMASHEEPFGLVYLEAMAAGTPIVADKSGGTPEVVSDGESGALVNTADPSRFAAALVTLLRDGHLRRRLGEAGRRRAETIFTVASASKLTLDVYRTLVEK